MNCGMSMVKYVLFIFNLLCALCGILFIVLGALLFSNINKIGDIKSVVAQSFPIAILVLGGLIFIIAFFGCCGAIRESECMSMTYATLLFVLLVLDIALVALIFTTKDAQTDISHTIVDEAFKTALNPNSAMSFIQTELECCGKNSASDYSFYDQLLHLPASCCKNTGPCNLISAYSRGCREALSDWTIKNANKIAYAALGIIAVELVGFIFACCLANHIRNHKRRSTY